MLDLPDHFLLKNQGGGGLSVSATDSFFQTSYAAKSKKMKDLDISLDDPKYRNNLIIFHKK